MTMKSVDEEEERGVRDLIALSASRQHRQFLTVLCAHDNYRN